MPVVSFYRSKYEKANMQKAENILSFNAVVTKAFAIGEDYAGALKFVATAPVDYFGQQNTLMLYDTTGYLMPNSYALFHDADKQIATMQNPANANEFFVFHIDKNVLYKTTIDMTLNDGKGDVVNNKKNIAISSGENYTGHFAVVERQDKGTATLYYTTHTGTNTSLWNYTNDGTPEYMCGIYDSKGNFAESYGVTDLKVNPYGKQILLYHRIAKKIPIFGIYKSEIREIDISNPATPFVVKNNQLYSNALCNVEYSSDGKDYQQTAVGFNIPYVGTGGLLRLADKNVYQNLVLSNQLASTMSVINFNNYLNGFVANNNVRYYKTVKEPDIFTRIVGNKLYELNDHLGNVRATVSDRRLGEYADLRSSVMYYPFGMPIANRTQSLNYRFGFNGKENDNEVNGNGRFQDYGFRSYMTDIARFASSDPLRDKYPSWTTYAFAMNRVIDGVDLDGLEWKETIEPIFYVSGLEYEPSQEKVDNMAKTAFKGLAVASAVVMAPFVVASGAALAAPTAALIVEESSVIFLAAKTYSIPVASNLAKSAVISGMINYADNAVNAVLNDEKLDNISVLKNTINGLDFFDAFGSGVASKLVSNILTPFVDVTLEKGLSSPILGNKSWWGTSLDAIGNTTNDKFENILPNGNYGEVLIEKGKSELTEDNENDK